MDFMLMLFPWSFLSSFSKWRQLAALVQGRSTSGYGVLRELVVSSILDGLSPRDVGGAYGAKNPHALAELCHRSAPLMTHVLVRLVLVAHPLRSVSRVLSTEAVVCPIFDGSWPRDVGGAYGAKSSMRSQGCAVERHL